MNEVALKGILKLLKTMVSPEQIQEIAQSFLRAGIDYKNSFPVDNEAGEVEACFLAYEVGGVGYYCIAFLNKENKITRFEEVRQFNDLVENLIKKL